MRKKSTIENQINIKEYHTFVKQNYKPTLLKTPQYYLKNYSYFKELANAMPCAIYMLDYSAQNYVFISESCKNITGYTSEEHMKMGQFEFYKNCMQKDDAKLFAEKVFFKFVESAKALSNNGLKDCRFSLNYRLKRKDGTEIKILQQSVVLETNDDGYPLLSLGILTDITAHKLDNKMVLSVSCFDEINGFKTISSNSYSAEEDKLTSREKEITKHIVYGHSTSKIAKIVGVSNYTINAHRRNIYEKINCKNVAELINYAINNGIA